MKRSVVLVVIAAMLLRTTVVSAGYIDGMGLYQYVRSNPSNYVDPDGRQISIGLGAAEAAAAGWSAADIAATFGLSLEAAQALVAAAAVTAAADRLYERYKANARTRSKDECQDPCKELDNMMGQAQDSIDSLRRNMTEHEKKILDFLRDPRNFPNSRWDQVPPQQRPDWIQREVNHWRNEIDTFQKDVRSNEEALKRMRKEYEEKGCGKSGATPIALAMLAFVAICRRRFQANQLPQLVGG